MNADNTLAAILAAIQVDPGNRGLARDPHDNLFTACPGDFAAACRDLAGYTSPAVQIVTGFFIPTADPPALETDGPLGAVFLVRAFARLGIAAVIVSDAACERAVSSGLDRAGERPQFIRASGAERPGERVLALDSTSGPIAPCTHRIALERVGPAADGRCYTMRGRDVTNHTAPLERLFTDEEWMRSGPVAPATGPSAGTVATIGIGDGGNEIGMGKIVHETVVKNIANGDRIHCRIAADRLIVAGVSNWGAYALAAGVFALRGVTPPSGLFDPDRERDILATMVRAGPLVDGVTGRAEASVDGLSWEEYVAPLRTIRDLVG